MLHTHGVHKGPCLVHYTRNSARAHCTQVLPSFDGALRPREAELLLQYLTVPYLRVPLLLRFFAQPSHLHALGSAKLQALSNLSGSPSAWNSAWDSALDSALRSAARSHLDAAALHAHARVHG